jgi:arylsulfatase A-like enzyme
MRSFLTALATATAVACLRAPPPASDGPAIPPNIVLIVLDDLGYGGFPVYEADLPQWQTPVETPHIDSLARAGIRFTRYYNAAPVCSPTRVSLLTGLYPQRLGIYKQLNLVTSLRGIPPGVDTLPELLRRRGYRTGHLGKWHVGDVATWAQPVEQGFDSSAVLRMDSVIPIRHNHPQIQFSSDWSECDGGDDTCVVDGHASRLLFDYTLHFIREHHQRFGDRPFFVNLWLWAPHTPYQVPDANGDGSDDEEDWRAFSPAYARYRARGLAAGPAQLPTLVTDVDHQVGRLLRLLAELGLERNTIVIATADNGGIPQLTFAANGPLRGFKGTPFEGGVRGPLVIRWPSRVQPGQVTRTPVSSLDLHPTLAEAAGIPPGSLAVDGRSFLAILTRTGSTADANVDPQPPRQLFWETTPCTQAFARASGLWDDFAVLDGDLKLVYQAVTGTVRCREFGPPAWFLFDLDRDPRESAPPFNPAVPPPEAQRLINDYLGWRRDTTLLPLEVDAVDGMAEVEGREVTLDGGLVRLAANPLDDVHDGQLSLSARIQVAEGVLGRRTIAARESCWRLDLRDDRRIELTLWDHSSGRPVILVSRSPLPGDPTRVTFTVFGWDRRERHPSDRELAQVEATTIRLFFGGTLQAENLGGLGALRVSATPIVLGGTQSTPPAVRFRGQLSDLRLHVASLSVLDLEALEREPMSSSSQPVGLTGSRR